MQAAVERAAQGELYPREADQGAARPDPVPEETDLYGKFGEEPFPKDTGGRQHKTVRRAERRVRQDGKEDDTKIVYGDAYRPEELFCLVHGRV